MKWILAAIIAVAMCGCDRGPAYRVTLYMDNGSTRYWMTRYASSDDCVIRFYDDETGELVMISGTVTVEIEHDAEKP